MKSTLSESSCTSQPESQEAEPLPSVNRSLLPLFLFFTTSVLILITHTAFIINIQPLCRLDPQKHSMGNSHNL